MDSWPVCSDNNGVGPRAGPVFSLNLVYSLTDPLAERRCEPCEGGVPPLDADAATALVAELHGDWQLDLELRRISRRFNFVGFNRPLAFLNAVAFIAATEGHHPELALGYGYCTVTYWTHAIDGLSDNDFICAAKIDRLVGDE